MCYIISGNTISIHPFARHFDVQDVDVSRFFYDFMLRRRDVHKPSDCESQQPHVYHISHEYLYLMLRYVL